VPSYIVKPKPDEDFYIYWSTVVDSPTRWGTRKELKHDLAGDSLIAGNDQRFERADETGTSSIDGFEGWDDTEFVVREIGPQPFVLRREDFRAFCESWDGHKTYDASLTRPWVPED
jgi:hypothetical protein